MEWMDLLVMPKDQSQVLQSRKTRWETIGQNRTVESQLGLSSSTSPRWSSFSAPFNPSLPTLVVSLLG